MIHDRDCIDTFTSIEVVKSNRHAAALNKASTKLFHEALPQDETKLKSLIKSLAKDEMLLFVMYPPATIGALSADVAQSSGFQVAYISGLDRRRIADLHSAETKTDSRDAYLACRTHHARITAHRRGLRGTGSRFVDALRIRW